MSTYYKYAERNVENQIDWSEIGKDFTNMLKTESELREKKKADIEKATQETLKTLADSPTGLDRGVNENVLNYASQGQKYMLMMNRLLKSGQLDPKDYSIYTQNLKSSTDAIFQTNKIYQEKYAKNVERVNSGKASKQEVYLREMVENAANFSKAQYYINQNGTATVGLPTKDPATGQYVLNNDPNTYNTPETLRYAATVDIDKYDVDKDVKDIVNSFGKNIFASAKLEGRVIRTIEDITARKGFADAEQNYIESLLVNPNSGTSILMDYIKTKTDKNGKIIEYGFTNNPNDPKIKSGESILMVPDPNNPRSGALTPQLNPEQKKEAEQFLRERIRAGLDYEAKTQYFEPQQPTEASLNRQDKEKEAQVFGEMLGKYVNPKSAEEFDAAKAYFNNIEGLEGLSKGATAIDVFKNGKLLRTNYGPNSDMRSLAGSLIPALNVNGLPEATIRKYALMQGGGVNTQLTGKAFKQSTVPPKEDPLGQFNKYVDAYIGSTVKDTEEDTVPLLRARFGKLGYTFEETGAGKDIVLITGPDKTSVEIDLSSSNAAGEIADFMKGNTDIKKIGLASGMGSLSLPKQKKSSQKPTVTGGIVR
jgi:hypothetical protein